MIRYIAAVALLSAPVGAQQIYDLLLKNGQVIDPANHRSGRWDVAVAGNRIARVGHDLAAAHARVVIDVSQYYVTPGLIDIHTHFDAAAGHLNLQPDHNALPSGVATAVDAGSSGWRDFEAFKAKIIDHSKTRLLAFVNIAGRVAGPAVEDKLPEMDPVAAAQLIRKYPEIIVGVNAGDWQAPAWDAVDRAVRAAELSNTIVMAEFSPQPGREYPDLILKHLRPGDIQTHIYSRQTPQLDSHQKVQPWMWEARQHGVVYDVGHGSDGFWFRIAVPAISQGLLPDTISTDIDRSSILLPRANMITTMSKFLNIGMTLDQIVERTTVNPARAIRRPDLGSLGEGAVADIAVIEMQEGKFGFLDSGHGRLLGDRRLRCVLTVRNGTIVWDSEGLSARDWIEAGPYSNFR